MRRSMLIGLLFHPGKQWSDRNQKIWPWCCCLLAMLRSVVIGAKQPMFDKALNVKNLRQLEIRLTRGKNLSILIATGEQVRFGCHHKTRTCTGHVLGSSKVKQKKPNQPKPKQKNPAKPQTKKNQPQTTPLPQLPKPTSYFPALKGEALQYLTPIWHMQANTAALAQKSPKFGTTGLNLKDCLDGIPWWYKASTLVRLYTSVILWEN